MMFDWRANPTRRGITRAFLSFVCFIGVAFTFPATADPGAVEQLQIVTATGIHDLSVEIARTAEEQEKGLMFRRSLPENGGMLFDLQSEQEVSMWMKNTFIPLDILFVSYDGRIVSVAPEAQPMSEAIISSRAPAAAVIEVNAGMAKKLAVEVGDLVRHPIFSTRQDK